MKFIVLKGDVTYSSLLRDTALLFEDSWDDYFTYQTTYRLIIFDSAGVRFDAGLVKIGKIGSPKGRPEIPREFTELDETFFSLGQDQNYYESIFLLGKSKRELIFKSLRDCARHKEIYKNIKVEAVLQSSLMRFITEETLERFYAISTGNAVSTEFNFNYQLPFSNPIDNQLSLDFRVVPKSNPPTNIHVLIGRNGVGKTRCLRLMCMSVLNPDHKEYGKFSSIKHGDEDTFANVISVAFSAFDPFAPVSAPTRNKGTMRYEYIGLRQQLDENNHNYQISNIESNPVDLPLKGPRELSSEFVTSLKKCSTNPRLERWLEAIEILGPDDTFDEYGIRDFVFYVHQEPEKIAESFYKLSSGHKIVLLTVAKLVEHVDDRSLVLIDEPEAHLHPPLLSALVRAISYLLTKRNGAAIIATHSPVVLQEVPRSCVWQIARSGSLGVAKRVSIETFGENSGTLTREVFGLEVARSGYSTLIKERAELGDSYEEIVTYFGDQLGNEAKAIARALALKF